METKLLSREQAASASFLNASVPLREVAEDGHGQGLANFAGLFIQAVNSFGLSELHARQAERVQALKLPAAGARAAQARSKQHNDRGLRLLEESRATLKLFREELATFPDTAASERQVRAVREEFRTGLVELELKASDVAQIDAAAAEAFELVRSGANSLPDYLEHHLARLEKVRRQPDRGAVDNIPIWKVIAIVVALGVWIWAFFRCSWWGRCSFAEGLAYFVIFWLAALVVRFC